ncbi:hypothetical protein SELMODRAFT_425551 [Selaginella moellendorffii]|uniref:Trichohyalin-plectin-homology domain-containing protein n=1 Tax=Selaginella moellendorffii TaxID=88036 RepID=D8STG9_SELML|nr:hypothetical protein SELMODRAFT_425551 [Selaginella moellendorffii]
MGHEEDVNSIEVTNYDLERMRGIPPNNRYAKFLRKKEELRSLSKERYNKWPNTITAMREKRLADRKRELQKQEEELCKQDVIDAQSRAERRRHQEREAQINYRNKIDKLWQKQEEKWANFQKRQREAWKREEEAEQKKKNEDVQILKLGRLEQLEERKARRQNLKEIQEQDKIQLNRQAKEDEEVAKAKEEIRKKKVIEARSDFIASNEDQRMRKEAEKKRLKEMDKKIEEFAAYRDRVDQQRKDERVRKEAEKLSQRETMLMRLEKQLLEARTDTEKRLWSQEAAHKAAEDKKLQEKADRALADWVKCDRSRQQQIKLRKDRLARDKNDEMEEAMGVRERLQIIEAEEKAETRRARENNTYFAKENLKIAAERLDREKRERENEKKDYQSAFEAMERDEIPEDYIFVEE